MKTLLSLLLCAALPLAAVTYYVGPNGNDANNGLSPGQPFATFLTATEALSNNDTLVILEGVYTNPVNRLSVSDPQLWLGVKTNGTLLSGVTFRGEGPDKTILLLDAAGPPPNSMTDARIIRFQGTNNTLESLAIKGDLPGTSWWYPVVYIINNFNSVISNIYIKFPDTQVDRTGISPSWNSSVSNLLVTHCLVDGGGVGVKDFNNDDRHKTTFRNLTLVNQRDSGNSERGIGIIVEGNDGTIIKNCIMMNQTRWGISTWAPDSGVSTTFVQNCIWYNATNGFADVRANTVMVSGGITNLDPVLQNAPNGLPYCSPLTYAEYGWRAVPEPAAMALLALGAGWLLCRR